MWDNLRSSDNAPAQENLAKWEAEFSQLMNSQREDLEHDYGESMQQAWSSGIGDFQEEGFTEGIEFDDDGLPILGEYIFGT
jgi:peroxin-5